MTSGPEPGSIRDSSLPSAPAGPRERLAAAVRSLLDTVLTVDADGAAVDEAAETTEAVVARLRARGRRRDGWSARARRHEDYLPRSPALGALHPSAPPLAWRVRNGRFVAEGTLGAAFEGPPGYVHGGWVALLFDEALGVANVAGGDPGMTARLHVRYRRPTPLHAPLRLEAWTTGRQGRRITTAGTLHAGPTLCAEAEGLFVDIGADRALEYFGERPAVPDPVDPLP
jgi:acyl-coenzyme A thioesterase PaaI-like protein